MQRRKRGEVSLKYRIFLHSYLGFNSNSTLIYGEKDAVLVDASQLLSDSYTLAGEILRMRVNLTHIYVSHFHPDHHFGLQVLHVAFPDARIVALPLSVADIVATSSDKVDMWAIDRFGPGDIPKATTIPEPLAEPRLELEGEEIVFSGGWEGDSIDNSVVWIPSLRTVLATDVAFHDCNLWPIESNVERRKTWRKDIARLMDFDPRIVVPGHHDAAKLRILEEVLEDESRTYTDCVEWSIKYLEAYDEAYAAAKTGAELVELMTRYYGDVKAEDFAIHWQARLLFPESSPDWLTPLPGKPGEIFLNPAGGYDGDPPRE
jgi:glyoxylase-like metal-dependent hydrolase (beta-lactamase superfamily II)